MFVGRIAVISRLSWSGKGFTLFTALHAVIDRNRNTTKRSQELILRIRIREALIPLAH
jgi:hypothetical protein